MNFWALQYFVKAAEYSQFAKAADIMCVSQSTISKAIAALEKETGVLLFERDGKKISLTSYGKVFLSHAICAIEELQIAKNTIQSMQQLNKGHIKIGALSVMCKEFLPELIWAFQDENPDIQLSIQYSLSSKILYDLGNRHIHLGISGDYIESEPEFAGFSRALLWQDDLELIVSKRHKLAKKYAVKLDDLKTEDFIVFNWNNIGIDLTLNNACKLCGFKPRVKVNALNETNVIGKVAAGEGIAVISSHAHVTTPHVHQIKIVEPALIHRVYLVWKEEDISHSKDAQAFKKFMLNHNKKINKI